MDKRSVDRSTSEGTKAWLDQRRQQKGGTLSTLGPHTPPAQRTISTFSSPGSILGKEEDAVIIELTHRHLYAGSEGDSGPQCKLACGPESCRRVGDYRVWIPGYRRRTENLESWGRGYELWRGDVTDLDLGLLSDVLERSIREAYNKHLLVDAGAGRLVLVLPSLVPHPVLGTMLTTLFQRWKYPSITLLPAPTMAVVGAGLRSGLVVDVGWEETVVTPVCEYREVNSHRTIRAMKRLTSTLAKYFKDRDEFKEQGSSLRFDLELVEEVYTRAVAVIDASTSFTDDTLNSDIEIEWPGPTSSQTIKIAKRDIATIISNTFLGIKSDDHYDDDEYTLPQLLVKALVSLSPDMRGTCMSRIIFTGQGSESSLLRREVLKHTESLARNKRWSTVKGKNTTTRTGLSQSAQDRTEAADAQHLVFIPEEKDDVEKKIQKQKAKFATPHVQPTFREVHSLGAWSGASLLTSLKIRGFVEIDRDRFLSHGLSGASRDGDGAAAPQQRMSTFGLPPAVKGDRNSWTLGNWG